jgi:3-deoxy-7-phosphoheptulonate synthase
MKELSHLPIFVDPTHGTGRVELIQPMSMAAVAAGADGLMVEVHHDPEHAMSDGPQALLPEQFETLMVEISRLREALGGTIHDADAQTEDEGEVEDYGEKKVREYAW